MPPVRTLRRALPSAAVALLMPLAAAAPSASASTGKEVGLTLPATVPAGTITEISATFSNPYDARQQLGSANLKPPADFELISATVPGPATADVNTRTGELELRDLSLRPDTSVTARITLRAPCIAPASPRWDVTLKQANDFNGSGNAMSLTAGSARSTTVSEACRLAFTTQPTSTEINKVISGTANTSPSEGGTPVGVAFVDGAGQPVPSGTGSVTLSVVEPDGAPAPNGNTASFASETGIASFGVLSIKTAGTYKLRAQTIIGTTTVRSDLSFVFRIDTISKLCKQGEVCTGTVDSNRTSFKLDALASLQTPRLTLSLNAGLDLDETLCGAKEGSLYMDDTALFNVTESDRQKRMSLTVPKDILQIEPDNGAPRIEMCFASPLPFFAKGSATKTLPSSLTFDWGANGGEEAVYVGLLPNCPAPEANQPCVTQRKKISGGRGYIEATLPSTYGDPAMRG